MSNYKHAGALDLSDAEMDAIDRPLLADATPKRVPHDHPRRACGEGRRLMSIRTNYSDVGAYNASV